MEGRNAERLPDLGQTSGVGALAATDGENDVDLILLDQTLQRILPLRGRFADGISEAELAAFRHHHGLQLLGEDHQLVDVLGRLGNDGNLARRR